MRRLRNALACIALALACWMIVEAALLIHQSREVLEKRNRQLDTTLRAVNVLVQRSAQTASNLKDASEEWKRASAEQRRYWREAAFQLSATLSGVEGLVRDLRDAVRKTDDHLNTALLPEAHASLVSLHESLEKLETTMSNAERVSAAVEGLASSPENAALVSDLRALVQQGRSTLAEAEALETELKKVPPVARKALWVQILAAIAAAFK